MSNFAEHRVRVAQAIELAMDDLARIIREDEAGIVLHHVKPAAASRFAEEVGVGREQLGHRMHIAAHERAVDEEAVGGHGFRCPSLRVGTGVKKPTRVG
jgi:hypothetical protein